MINALRISNGKATLMIGETYIPVQIETIDQTPYSPTTFTGRMLDPYFKQGKSTRKTAVPDTYVGPFKIKDVIFNNPATIVLWADGTKTVVKCQEDDVYSEEVGLALCFAKKALGNKSNFNNVFKKWVPEEEEEPVKMSDISNSPAIGTDHIGKFIDQFISRHRRPFAEGEV